MLLQTVALRNIIVSTVPWAIARLPHKEKTGFFILCLSFLAS